MGRLLPGLALGVLTALLLRPLGIVSALAVGGCVGAAWRFGSSVAPPRFASGHRLEFLDAARGVAALMVALDHVLEVHAHPFYLSLNRWVYWGHVGVTLFFLISGFIIPATLERGGSPWGFPINRGFRILPLYYLAFAATLVVRYAIPGMLSPDLAAHPGRTILLGLTLAHNFAGVEGVLPLSWTLCVEAFFYLAAWLLRRAGLFVRTEAVVLVGSGLLLMQGARTALGGSRSGLYLLAWTLVFLAGGLVYRVATGALSGRRALGPLLAALVAVPAGLILQDLHTGGGAIGRGPADVLIGAGLFGGFYLLRGRAWPRLLTWLGRMSYGVYLWHGVILLAVPGGWAVGPSLVAIVGGALGLAALTHRWVEEPAIAFGRRLAGRMAGADPLRRAGA